MTQKLMNDGKRAGTWRRSLLLLSAWAVIVGGCVTATPRRSPDFQRWPTELVGSWGFVPAARDTAVWTLRPNGHLIRSRVEVRNHTVKERGQTYSRWWTERSEGGYRLCTTSRAGRGSMCGTVRVEGQPSATPCARRTLVWTGTTFRQQWTLVERRPCETRTD